MVQMEFLALPRVIVRQQPFTGAVHDLKIMSSKYGFAGHALIVSLTIVHVTRAARERRGACTARALRSASQVTDWGASRCTFRARRTSRARLLFDRCVCGRALPAQSCLGTRDARTGQASARSKPA